MKNGIIPSYSPDRKEWSQLLARPTFDLMELDATVLGIFKEIQQKGDEAVRKYTELFDGPTSQIAQLSSSEIDNAKIEAELEEAILVAKSNIEKFHKAQQTSRIDIETMDGVQCWQEKKPIPSVGLYIPGGTAPLFSTVLMLAIPAVLAGCQNIVLCSPPDKEGEIHPAILVAARLCGIDQIFKVGGIQAIAAMTFGTETIPKVDKLFGPGNQYVTAAKQMATRYGTAIDMPAGPSELLVFADDSADPSFVAADLLSQAEHGADSQVILVSTSKSLLADVSQQLKVQLEQLPRQVIASKAIENSKFIWMESDEEALELINYYAPEHFIICAENETYFVENIMNAGSVFIGNYTPESAGDYASGTNHTLPTNGYARQYSGVGLDSFLKRITFQKISKSGITQLGPYIERMATAEGLDAHKEAVSIRLKSLAESKQPLIN